MTKVLGSKLGALWTRINTILVPRQATVNSGGGCHTVTLQNCNTPTPDALVSFDIPMREEVAVATTQPVDDNISIWVNPDSSSSNSGTYTSNYVKFTRTDSPITVNSNSVAYFAGPTAYPVTNTNLATLNSSGLITIQKTGFYLIIFNYAFTQTTNTNNTISGIFFTNATSPSGWDISGNEVAHNVDYIYTGNIGYAKTLTTVEYLTAETSIGTGLWSSQAVSGTLSNCRLTLIYLNDQILI